VARGTVAHPQRCAVFERDIEVDKQPSPTRWAQVRRIHALVVGSSRPESSVWPITDAMRTQFEAGR
jgi:hypothetical protein